MTNIILFMTEEKKTRAIYQNKWVTKCISMTAFLGDNLFFVIAKNSCN